MSSKADYFQHEAALVEADPGQIGPGTRIWAFAHLLPGAVVGADCNICDHVFIENDVCIGDRVTIKSGVQLWDGLRVEDDVFIGPNATFTNDKFPRSRQKPEAFPETVIAQGASIGANATVLPGLSIGAGAMVGAGAVVTRDVPANAVVAGNPAVITGYVDVKGQVTETTAAGPQGDTALVGGAFLRRLKHVNDLRGDLAVTDIDREIPFAVKRMFWVYNVPSLRIRGAHVHRELEEFVVCLAGSVSVVVDDGGERREVDLDHPSLGLYLPPRVWRTLYKYSPDAVLLVLASHEYDPDDYIRDYTEFQALVAGPA